MSIVRCTFIEELLLTSLAESSASCGVGSSSSLSLTCLLALCRFPSKLRYRCFNLSMRDFRSLVERYSQKGLSSYCYWFTNCDLLILFSHSIHLACLGFWLSLLLSHLKSAIVLNYSWNFNLILQSRLLLTVSEGRRYQTYSLQFIKKRFASKTVPLNFPTYYVPSLPKKLFKSPLCLFKFAARQMA